jgi:RNA polymerase sigma factor (sigma-70 family)
VDSQAGSISREIGRLQAGELDAAGWLYERCYQWLWQKTRKGLRSHPELCRLVEADEISISAFEQFRLDVVAGKLPDVQDRDSLFRLLAWIIQNKIITRARRELSAKRGGGRVRVESELSPAATQSNEAFGLDRFADPASFEPAFKASLEDLLRLLDDDEQRRIAVLLTEGYGPKDIAKEIGRSESTVRRKLDRIRTRLMEDLA